MFCCLPSTTQLFLTFVGEYMHQIFMNTSKCFPCNTMIIHVHYLYVIFTANIDTCPLIHRMLELWLRIISLFRNRYRSEISAPKYVVHSSENVSCTTIFWAVVCCLPWWGWIPAFSHNLAFQTVPHINAPKPCYIALFCKFPAKKFLFLLFTCNLCFLRGAFQHTIATV